MTENMKKHLLKVRDLIHAFYSFDIQQIYRIENIQAYALAKLAICMPHDLYAQVFFVVEELGINESILVL